MSLRPALLIFALLLTACGKTAAPLPSPEAIDHGRFKNVQLYRPANVPQSVVLLLSGAAGWDAHMARQAEALRSENALVIGIDNRQLLAALEADEDSCVFPDGDLENLSHFVQAYVKMPGYRLPVLAGFSTGATLAYATLVQAPADTFAAGLVTGFCPDLALKKSLCPGDGLRTIAHASSSTFLPRAKLVAPFVALRGEHDLSCDAAATQRFIAAMPSAQLRLLKGIDPNYDQPATLAALRSTLRGLTAKQAAAVPPAPSDLGELPVVEEPVPGGSPYLAIFWSGDGGWAGIDKEVAEALKAKGISVVGVDSLRYFWTARTPDGIATDVERIIHHYLAAWKKQKVLLIGYSQGADVLPFAVTRLPPAVRAQVALAVGMGLSDHAVFEFQLSNWVADNNDGPATLPEIARIKDVPFLCVYGADEDDTICPNLEGTSAQIVKLPGGHHFDEAYDLLAETILAALPKN